LCGVGNKAGADGIVYDVTDKRSCRFVIPQDVLVVPHLPKPLTERARVPARSATPKQRHERSEISVVVLAPNQDVQVIWHEAIRQNCEALLPRGVQQLLQRRKDPAV
jgi:hypothetical protein